MYGVILVLYKWLYKKDILSLFLGKGKSVWTQFFESNTWIKCFFCILGVWVLFVIVRYPGIENGGVANQFRQYLGVGTLARSLSAVTYENSYITGHHPVLLTIVFGIFIKCGVLMGNPNIGMFALTCFVCVINALCWSYVLKTIKEYVNDRIWNFLFFVFLLNPMVISFNTYVLKDNLFASVLAVYSMLIFKLIHDKEISRVQMVQFVAISTLVPFVKNQGIYIVILTTIFLMIVERKRWKYWVLCLVMPILCFYVLFQGILMPMFRIAPGGKQEMFSIFFQTTARAIVENEEIKESEEYEIIQNVLPIDDWSVYDPGLSDPIKFQYNQNATTEEFLQYIMVWIEHGLEYPGEYLKALFEQTYGYYYIDYKTIDWVYNGYEIDISSDGDLTIDSPIFGKANERIYNFLNMCQRNNRWKYLFSVPAAFWIICISCVLYRGEIKKMIWIVPIFLQWLICLVSPVNGSGRYGMIIYEMCPFVIAWILSSIKGNCRRDEENSIIDRV